MVDDPGAADRAAILARRQRFIALALGGLATGCGPGQLGSEGGTTTVASSTSTGSSEATSEASETESEGPLETESSGSPTTFVPTTCQPCLSSSCDPFMQDCPEGEKCVPYGSTGGAWDAEKCVPVLGEGAPGEPCSSAGTVASTDDCDETSYCWDVEDIDGELIGVCAPFCEGTADEPLCGESSACLIANEGSITLCVDTCDPLLADCGEGFGCSWVGGGYFFACLLVTADVPPGEPCGFTNDCSAGSVCLANEATPDCLGAGCCVEYCALDDPEACPDPQLECAPFFNQGEGLPGTEMLGVCAALGACDGDGDPGCYELSYSSNSVDG